MDSKQDRNFVKNRWQRMGRNTRIVAISMVLWAIGEGLWLHIQPLYLSSLGATPQQTGFILGMAGLARLLVMLPAGLLADRHGARKVMLPGWFLGLGGVILIAAAPNFYVLTIGFFLYGASALGFPILNLYLIQSLTEDRTITHRLRPQEALTFIYALFWLGQILSPGVGGILADWFSLRMVFGISTIWLALSLLVILQTEAYPPPPGFRPTLRQYQDRLRQPHLATMYGVFLLAFISTSLGYIFAPQFLEDIHELPRSTIGLMGSVLAAGSFVWNIILGRQRAWSGLLAAATMTAVAFGVLLISGHIIVLLLSFFLIGAFETLRPVATSIIADHMASATQGVGFSLVDTLHGAGTFIAPGLAGILYAQGTSWPFLAAMVFIPVIYMLVVRLQRNLTL